MEGERPILYAVLLVQVVSNEVMPGIFVWVCGTEPRFTFVATLTVHCLLTVADTVKAKDPTI